MKRINIQKDVASRTKIATTQRKPIAKVRGAQPNNQKPTEDAKSEEIQKEATDTPADTAKETPPKRGRTTKRDTQTL